ncbi:unnamed protein product [Phytophthora lilii]|uniref:Unnamed protein product n=1 Tax=Phytophthora lilii TaxID=2077276 RepID=A0A9W6WN42_9STRA|nr:unnamed protein product [Phytophthora lilii]
MCLSGGRLLGGAKVLGSYDESTRDTLKRLTAPTSALSLVIHNFATRYAELKTTLHGEVPKDFDPRIGMKASAEETMMEALLDALRDVHYSERQYERMDKGEASESNSLQTAEVSALPVFLLRDFDTLSDQDTERWLHWTHQVSSEGLAYVVLLSSSTVTPSKVEWLQARHHNGLGAVASDGIQDFVAILLRPANGLVDSTSAEQKLRDLSELHGLNLFADLDSATDEDDFSDDKASAEAIRDGKRAAEIEAILKATGNWWSDIKAICQRLKSTDLDSLTVHEERIAVIQEVCNSFLQDTEASLLEALHLDGSLQLPWPPQASDTAESSLSKNSGSNLDSTDTSKALSALETWKCLETLADVTPVTGGNALIGSPQQLLKQKDNTPLNCVSPVEALLSFNYREEGEQKFLDLVDQEVLFLRPKVC